MNFTLIVDYYSSQKKLISEKGFSTYIVDENTKILFDTGLTKNLILNANELKINLLDLDYIVFSHGHHDHTSGLFYLLELYKKEKLKKKNYPKIIAHPDAFYSRSIGSRYIGTKLSKKEIETNFNVIYKTGPFEFTKNLIWLGQIPRNNSFEAKAPTGKITKKSIIDDYVYDDTAIVYRSSKGLVVIAGCSHSGICNILSYAKIVMNEKKINTVIGGFHLKHSNEKFIDLEINELKKFKVKQFHACHCTGDLALSLFNKSILNQKNIGCGFVGNYS